MKPSPHTSNRLQAYRICFSRDFNPPDICWEINTAAQITVTVGLYGSIVSDLRGVRQTSSRKKTQYLIRPDMHLPREQ